MMQQLKTERGEPAVVRDLKLLSLATIFPITALRFVDKFLLAGEGSGILCYDVETQKLCKRLKIFTAARVHGLTHKETANQDQHSICVYGAKSLRLCSLISDGPELLSINQEVELEDWIWDVTFLSHTDCLLAVVLGHNMAVIFDPNLGHVCQRVECEEKCFLYTATFVGQTWENLVVAAGTVYNQVVLWGTQQDDRQTNKSKVMHRLLGHQGVIFSVAFHNEHHAICSVSDDRSLRLWKVNTSVELGSMPLDKWTINQWQHATFTLAHVLYGHESRVWDVAFMDSGIASIGEDCCCCIWDYDGHVTEKFKGHVGKNIWSLAVKADGRLVATGGGDASIRLWHLGSNSQGAITEITPQMTQKEDYPRTVKLLDESTILMMTFEGHLLLYNTVTGNWKTVYNDPEYRSYSVIAWEPQGNYLIVGNILGNMKIYHKTKENLVPLYEIQVCESKIFSLVCCWHGNTLLLVVTSSNGCMTVWKLQQESLDECELIKICELSLPYSKQRWITTSICLPENGNLVVGDRGGSIHVYSINKGVSEPIQSFLKIHGKSGVTAINVQGNIVYSCGRDGHLREYRVEQDGKLKTLSCTRVLPGVDWLCGLKWHNGNLNVLAFHMDQLIIFDPSHNQHLAAITCGGGHRAWDTWFDAMFTRGRVVYIKSREIIVCDVPLISNLSIIKPNLHGKEIKNIHHIFKHSTVYGQNEILITGAEDNSMHVLLFYKDLSHEASVKQEFYSYRIMTTLQGHLCNIRALATVKCHGKNMQENEESYSSCTDKTLQSLLLFSAGGRAQVKVWRVKILKSLLDTTLSADEISCEVEHLSDHMLSYKGLKTRKPWKHRTEGPIDSETRYMAVTAFSAVEVDHNYPHNMHFMAAACSDGYVRLFQFLEDNKTMEVIFQSEFHDHCVLVIKHIIVSAQVSYSVTDTNSNNVYVFSGCTGGNIVAWNMTKVIKKACDYFMLKFEEEECLFSNAGNDATTKPDMERFEELKINDIKSEFPLHLEPPVCVLNSHQSGINALDVKDIEGQLWIASGGDDNSLIVQKLKYVSQGHFEVVMKVQQISAHAAQITGVHLLGDKVITASIDQRLCVWGISMQESRLNLIHTKFIGVSDLASMTAWPSGEECIRLAFAGVGVEMLEVMLEVKKQI